MPVNLSLMGHNLRQNLGRGGSSGNSSESSDASEEPIFPPRSSLWRCPEEVQWDIYDNALSGGPTLKDQYGPHPGDYVVSAIRYGPSGVTTASITTVTNKAVISALLLTFNYGAVSTAAQEPDSSDLFRTYFFCQMTSVVLAFCVMLTAATYISHVSRCGQHTGSLIRYLRGASWIDRHLNEPIFVAQCFFTTLALVLNVALTYNDSFMLYSFIGMVVLSIGLLAAAHVRSRRVLRKLADAEWQQTLQAEEEFRVWASHRRHRGGGGGGHGAACPVAGVGASDPGAVANGVSGNGGVSGSGVAGDRGVRSDAGVPLVCEPRVCSAGGEGDCNGGSAGGGGCNGAVATQHAMGRRGVRAAAATDPGVGGVGGGCSGAGGGDGGGSGGNGGGGGDGGGSGDGGGGRDGSSGDGGSGGNGGIVDSGGSVTARGTGWTGAMVGR